MFMFIFPIEVLIKSSSSHIISHFDHYLQCFSQKSESLSENLNISNFLAKLSG